MAPKKRPIPAVVKGGIKPPMGGEMDELARKAFPEEEAGFAAVAHSSTPDKREKRQLLREAHKKGVKPEVLAAIGRSSSPGSTAPPSPAAAGKKGGKGG
jgi:hypothetical protein